ncbi:MAG: hypothetical protein RLY32_2500, partial [Pseudomonadota bacterium]
DDLLMSTPRQIALQGLLGYRKLRYLHIPVLKNSQGQKLSKQQGAQALCPKQALENLKRQHDMTGAEDLTC